MAEFAAAPYRSPVYDSGNSVQHAEMAAAIAPGDATGIAAACYRYAEGLYTYCRSQLTQPAEAADAVRDTFVTAAAKASELSQPERLHAWLFAVARYECHVRLRDGVPSAQLYDAAQAMDDTGTFTAVFEQTEFRALVRAALAGLDPVDREISELNLRHGLYGADLAAVLGAPCNQAHTLAARARSRFEKSLGVLLMARADREHCPELAAVLDSHNGKLSLRLRWRVKRHIGECEICGERKRGGLNPEILATLLPVVPLPAGLEQQILDSLSDNSPAAAAHRAHVVDRGPRFGAGGFPVQLTTPSAPGSRLTSVSAAAVAAAALALLSGAMYYVGHSFSEAGNLAAVGPGAPLIAPTGSSSGYTRAPAAVPSGVTPAPSPSPDLLPAASGPTGPVPPLFFTLPSNSSSSLLTSLSPSATSPSHSTSPVSSPPSSVPPSSVPPSSVPPSSPLSSAASSAASSVSATAGIQLKLQL